jgi:hypothetical protein
MRQHCCPTACVEQRPEVKNPAASSGTGFNNAPDVMSRPQSKKETARIREIRTSTDNSALLRAFPPSNKKPTGLRLVAKSWELRKDDSVRLVCRLARAHPSERAPGPASTVDCPQYCPRRINKRRSKKRDYFFAFAFAGAAFGLAAGAAFFTRETSLPLPSLPAQRWQALLSSLPVWPRPLLAASWPALPSPRRVQPLPWRARPVAGAALAGAAFAAGFAGFRYGGPWQALPLPRAQRPSAAAGAAFFIAVATFAAAAFTGAFFAGVLDAGALDDCLAMRCPFRCADGR